MFRTLCCALLVVMIDDRRVSIWQGLIHMSTDIEYFCNLRFPFFRKLCIPSLFDEVCENTQFDDYEDCTQADELDSEQHDVYVTGSKLTDIMADFDVMTALASYPDVCTHRRTSARSGASKSWAAPRAKASVSVRTKAPGLWAMARDCWFQFIVYQWLGFDYRWRKVDVLVIGSGAVIILL